MSGYQVQIDLGTAYINSHAVEQGDK